MVHTQAHTLLELIGRFLPEERIWLCDECGADVARNGVIDLARARVECYACFEAKPQQVTTLPA